MVPLLVPGSLCICNQKGRKQNCLHEAGMGFNLHSRIFCHGSHRFFRRCREIASCEGQVFQMLDGKSRERRENGSHEYDNIIPDSIANTTCLVKILSQRDDIFIEPRPESHYPEVAHPYRTQVIPQQPTLNTADGAFQPPLSFLLAFPSGNGRCWR